MQTWYALLRSVRMGRRNPDAYPVVAKVFASMGSGQRRVYYVEVKDAFIRSARMGSRNHDAYLVMAWACANIGRKRQSVNYAVAAAYACTGS